MNIIMDEFYQHFKLENRFINNYDLITHLVYFDHLLIKTYTVPNDMANLIRSCTCVFTSLGFSPISTLKVATFTTIIVNCCLRFDLYITNINCHIYYSYTQTL